MRLWRGLQMIQPRRDPEILKQKKETASALRQHARLLKEIAAIQKELERQWRAQEKGN